MAVFYCGDFDLFLRSILRQDLVSSILYFGGEGLQACIAWGVPPADVLLAVVRSRCKQRVVLRSSKSCVEMLFAGVPFPYCCFNVFFKFWWMMHSGESIIYG